MIIGGKLRSMWDPLVSTAAPQFWPPKPNRFWSLTLSPLRRFFLKRQFRIDEVIVEGAENLTGIPQTDGVLIAPNHSHDSDPHVMMDVARQLERRFYFMAAWQIFQTHSGIDGFVLQRMGAFSVDREGCDRRAMRTAMELLASNKNLVVFPEGEIYHTNARLTPLREGVAFMALSAQRDIIKAKAAAHVWIVPTAIRYRYVEDITAELEEAMDALEKRVAMKPANLPLHQRMIRFGDMMLTLKEKEKLGQSNEALGDLPTRLRALINTLLERNETLHLKGTHPEDSVPLRVKNLRRHLLETLYDENAAEDKQTDARAALDDVQLVMTLYSYPGDYVSEQPSIERMAETMEKFEEDILGAAQPKGKRQARVIFGEPMDLRPIVETGRTRSAATDLTGKLEAAIQQLMKTAQSG